MTTSFILMTLQYNIYFEIKLSKLEVLLKAIKNIAGLIEQNRHDTLCRAINFGKILWHVLRLYVMSLTSKNCT